MKKTLLALILLAGALVSARANLVLSDTFTYSDGPLTSVSGGLWVAHSAGGSNPIMVTNGQAILREISSSAEDDHRDYPQMYMTNSGLTLYTSYKLTALSAPGLFGTYISHHRDTNTGAATGYGARVFLCTSNTYTGLASPTNTYRISIGNGNSGGAFVGNGDAQVDQDLTNNVTYTVVTRFVLATGTSTLWINPTNESDPSVTATDIATNCPTCSPPANSMNNAINVVSYCFRQGSQTPSGTSTNLIDDLKVGTRFADVAGNNTSPLISGIPTMNTPRNTPTGAIPFSVQDAETPASELTVTVSSSNPAVVPNNTSVNLVLATVPGTGGTNHTLTITPASGAQGSTTITLSVSDSVNTTPTAFLLTVGQPSIGAVPSQFTSVNTPTPSAAFAVGDTEGDSLTLTASSSNPTLVAPGDIALGVSVPNVSSNVVITPEADQSGVSTITLSVTDGHTTNSTSFTLTVEPAPLGLIFNENFAYTDFDIPQALYNATGGSGGSWGHISGPTYEIQVTNVTGTSGFAYLVYTNNEDVGAGFSGYNTYDGSLGYVFYTSFTISSAFLPSQFGDYFFHLSSSSSDTSNFRDKVYTTRQTAVGANAFRFGVANISSSVASVFPRDLMPGATYAVVTRYNAATGESTLWVNPTSEQSAGAIATDSPGSSTIGGVGLRQVGCCMSDLTIGPMKVGTAFGDVWTAPSRPHLNWTVNGNGNLVLSWSNPLFVLQSASNAAGPYTDLAPSSPYTATSSSPQFFRLKY